ncbi:MAG: 3' terminal RNA ribose 2'-O-methyltransferase Hen1 [Rhodothermales bacterium]
MLLTITTTHTPATDLGYLLHKHPAKHQAFAQPFGQAHIFYPEATPERCTAALMLDVDPVGLVRGRKARMAGQYVNDRPYAASSLLSVAMADVYRSALNGRCKDRLELVDMPIPLEVTVAAVVSHGGEASLRRLFEPLGYAVEVTTQPLDTAFPEWGESPYLTLMLRATCRLADLLTHLYVLLPALDGDKHYWVGDAEVEKLLRRGEGWLEDHPEQAWITHRYLKRNRSLVRQALAQLAPEEEPTATDESEAKDPAAERPMRLHDQRLEAVMKVVAEQQPKRVLDLGCGEGKLLRMLLRESQAEEIVGMDVAHRTLERLYLDRLPEWQRDRIRLIHGSLLYRDARLSGFDLAAVVEVIEHLDPPRLAAFERTVFAYARPHSVVVTTPNREYNALFPSLPARRVRHPDHRFEWTRDEFRTWATTLAEHHGYTVTFAPIGPVDATHGAPTQMAVFTQLEQEVMT